MSLTAAETTAERLPRVSPSRLEAWDRCPAAYRFAYVLGLPQPVADQAPRLLGLGRPRARRGVRPRGADDGDATPLDRLPGSGAGTREPEGAAGGDDGRARA